MTSATDDDKRTFRLLCTLAAPVKEKVTNEWKIFATSESLFRCGCLPRTPRRRQTTDICIYMEMPESRVEW